MIRELAKDASDPCKRLLDLPAEKIKSASRQLEVRRLCISAVETLRLRQRISTKDIDLLTRFIGLDLNIEPGIIAVVPKDKFKGVLDDDFLEGLVDDKKLVLDRLMTGLRMIGLVSGKWGQNAEDVICSVFGLQDDRNSINSGFTHDAPGFISFNVNCDPEVIGEQIAHETTHLLFDNLLFFNDSVRSFVSRIPPVFSPFANKPRTAEYMIHGLFSYTSVYIYWKALQEKGLDRMGVSETRKQEVKKYIISATRNLSNVLDSRGWGKLKSIYKLLTQMNAAGIWDCGISMPKTIHPGEVLQLLDGRFSNIEKAEIVLALEGNKVSRISKPISDIHETVDSLNRLRLHYCFSNFLFESDSDKGLNDFSNCITKLHNLDSVSSLNLDIHIYLSKHRAGLLEAFALDEQDLSGNLFGIPSCCQSFFRNNWDHAVNCYNGDLARLTYGTEKFSISDSLVYSPVSMYFDSGYCWHFPCSPFCAETKRVIDKRIDVMQRYPELHERLTAIEGKTIHFNPLSGYELD